MQAPAVETAKHMMGVWRKVTMQGPKSIHRPSDTGSTYRFRLKMVEKQGRPCVSYGEALWVAVQLLVAEDHWKGDFATAAMQSLLLRFRPARLPLLFGCPPVLVSPSDVPGTFQRGSSEAQSVYMSLQSTFSLLFLPLTTL